MSESQTIDLGDRVHLRGFPEMRGPVTAVDEFNGVQCAKFRCTVHKRETGWLRLDQLRRCLALLALLLTPGCYLSHELPPAGLGMGGGAGREPDPSMDTAPDAGGPDAVPDAATRTAPVVYSVSPQDSCTNRGDWITLHGTGIDWLGGIAIEYPFSGAIITIVHDDTDADGAGIFRWTDVTEVAFRIPAELRGDNGSLPSGQYLVSAIDSDGNESNQVGLNLQWCAP